jgi:hypothetical protein
VHDWVLGLGSRVVFACSGMVCVGVEGLGVRAWFEESRGRRK